jgi:organic hydroperoxide reductase OsmC/OhrA
VSSAADVARAERLVQKAESSCLVSKSLKTPVRVKADVRVTS